MALVGPPASPSVRVETDALFKALKKTFTDEAKRGLYTERARAAVEGEDSAGKVLAHFEAECVDELVDRMMIADFPVASANENLLDLQHKMQASGSSAISVIEGGQFLGLATPESVRNALRLFYARGWRPVQS